MIKKMICIECPKSCELSVNIEDGTVTKVTGAKCPKGAAYAVLEVQEPARVLTATVKCAPGLSLKFVPVRTNKPIPKKDILRAMEEVRKMRVDKPVKSGGEISGNFLGLGVKLLATRELTKGSA